MAGGEQMIYTEKMKDCKWIPISQEMPEPNEHILLFLDDNKGQNAQVVGYLFFSNDKELVKFNNEFSSYGGGSMPIFLEKECVLAWQPLPLPYKE